MAGELTTEEWGSLIAFWTSGGHSIRHLDVPHDVAQQLGIEVETTEETGMTDTAAETMVHEPLGAKWKRKAYFDGTQCGLKDCSRKPDGYICDTKPTQGGKERLWFGPACTKCVRKIHENWTPMPLAKLAHQRNGVSDLALVLDIEVGEAKRRLAAEGIDEKGRKVDYVPKEEVVQTQQPQQPPQQQPQQQQPTAETTQGDFLVAVSTTVAVPATQLLLQVREAQGFVAYLATFHVSNQQMMDQAAAWLNSCVASAPISGSQVMIPRSS